MSRRTSLAAALLACACSGTPKGGAASAPVEPTTAPVAASTVLDDAQFTMTHGSTSLGVEHVTVRRTGAAETIDASASYGGGAQVTTTHIDLNGSLQAIGGSQSISVGGKAVSQATVTQEGVGLVGKSSGGGPDQSFSTPGLVDVLFASGTVAGFAPLCAAPPVSADGRDLVLFPNIKDHAIDVGHVALTQSGKPVDARAIQVTLQSVALDIYCDGDRLVGVTVPLQGVQVLREGYTGALLSARAKPALADGLTETEVTVESSGAGGTQKATLACSLILPASAASAPVASTATGAKTAKALRLPAVTFFTGSGPEDRDEDSPGPGGLKMAIFKVIANRLGQEGIASLRCDDRGVAKSTGDAATATAETYVADATAQVAFLKDDPRIDPTRIALIGHSEGAMVMPRVAVADPTVRALVLMAAPGRNLGDILEDQKRWAMSGAGAPQPDIDKEIAREHLVLLALRDGKALPSDTPADEAAIWQKIGPWLKSWLTYDPTSAMKALAPKTAVLLCQGDGDLQVSTTDQDLLSAALKAANHAATVVKRYHGLNHLFCPVRLGGMADYTDPAAVIDATFLDDVASFLHDQLVAR